ncbi:MAG: class I SAM-dependent methyltransferase [Myxococcota bacterium]
MPHPVPAGNRQLPDEMPQDPREADLLQSWRTNAVAWSDAVRSGRIRSRTDVTDAVIRDAIARCEPQRVLDLGCGEGWLVRHLSATGIDALGVDATPELVALARELGEPSRYAVTSYAALADDPKMHGTFDLVVANFSLLGDRSTRRVLHAVPRLLQQGGHLLVQTVHPFTVVGAGPSGWQPGSWEGCGEGFSDGAPWYCRTLTDWVMLLTDASLALQTVEEPRSLAGPPASLLIVAQRTTN